MKSTLAPSQKVVNSLGAGRENWLFGKDSLHPLATEGGLTRTFKKPENPKAVQFSSHRYFDLLSTLTYTAVHFHHVKLNTLSYWIN